MVVSPCLNGLALLVASCMDVPCSLACFFDSRIAKEVLLKRREGVDRKGDCHSLIVVRGDRDGPTREEEGWKKCETRL